jgi:hypothetical protein
VTLKTWESLSPLGKSAKPNRQSPHGMRPTKECKPCTEYEVPDHAMSVGNALILIRRQLNVTGLECCFDFVIVAIHILFVLVRVEYIKHRFSSCWMNISFSEHNLALKSNFYIPSKSFRLSLSWQLWNPTLLTQKSNGATH